MGLKAEVLLLKSEKDLLVCAVALKTEEGEEAEEEEQPRYSAEEGDNESEVAAGESHRRSCVGVIVRLEAASETQGVAAVCLRLSSWWKILILTEGSFSAGAS